jgi:hypothetical protein
MVLILVELTVFLAAIPVGSWFVASPYWNNVVFIWFELFFKIATDIYFNGSNGRTLGGNQLRSYGSICSACMDLKIRSLN